MTILENLDAANREQLRQAEARGQLLSLMRYLAKSLAAKDVAFEFIHEDPDTLLVSIDLRAPPPIEPPEVVLALPEPKAAKQCAAGEGGGAPVEAIAPAPVADVADKETKGDFVQGPYSPEEQKILARMMEKGATSGEVAKALNRRPNAVSVKMVGLRKAAAGGKVVKKPAPVPKGAAAPVPKPKKPAPPAQPVAASGKTKTPAAASVAFDEKTPHAVRALHAHLNALGYADGWSAGLDRDLVEHLLGGSSVANAAILLEMTPPACKARWLALNRHAGDLEHQKLLIEVLRARAEVA